MAGINTVRMPSLPRPPQAGQQQQVNAAGQPIGQSVNVPGQVGSGLQDPSGFGSMSALTLPYGGSGFAPYGVQLSAATLNTPYGMSGYAPAGTGLSSLGGGLYGTSGAAPAGATNIAGLTSYSAPPSQPNYLTPPAQASSYYSAPTTNFGASSTTPASTQAAVQRAIGAVTPTSTTTTPSSTNSLLQALMSYNQGA